MPSCLNFFQKCFIAGAVKLPFKTFCCCIGTHRLISYECVLFLGACVLEFMLLVLVSSNAFPLLFQGGFCQSFPAVILRHKSATVQRYAVKWQSRSVIFQTAGDERLLLDKTKFVMWLLSISGNIWDSATANYKSNFVLFLAFKILNQVSSWVAAEESLLKFFSGTELFLFSHYMRSCAL